MTEAEKAYQYFVIAVPENEEQAKAYFWARKALQPTLTPPNEWVRVEERLPRLRENVLVCAYWHEHWGVYIGWNNGHGWTVSCGIGQRNDVQVSHWMPLPAPPDRRPTEGDA
mgnify:CR=1 FL=1